MRNAVLLCLAANNIPLMHKGNHAFLLLAITCEKMRYRFTSQGFSLKKQPWRLNDKTILNSVIKKYRDLSVSCRSIICFSLRLRQIIDLLATDKSRYFAQPCPIIVNYFYFQKILDLGQMKNS